MKRISKRRSKRNLVILLGTLIACLFCVTTSWATLTYIKTQDASHPIQGRNINEIFNVQSSEQQNSRAPEPTTLALFASGFLGIAVRFIKTSYRMVKRVFDAVGAVIGLVFLSPLFVIVAVLVKITSEGPVFYKQTRVGKGGQLFEIIKFRTMKVDAEKDTGPVWAMEKDSRLTPIGGILRKTHIDEIPQFINVLKGEMSLIGPRPERPVFVDRFKSKINDYEKRLNVKPGITGMAQVWHRYDETIEDVKQKIKYDLLYIKRVCFWTDFRILLRTFRVVITGEGAR